MRDRRRGLQGILLCWAISWLSGCGREPTHKADRSSEAEKGAFDSASPSLKQATETGPLGTTGNHEPVSSLAVSPETLALGKATYVKQCAACHGLDGKGLGVAAYLLYPKPRDFVTARYRIISTWEGVPTDGDIFRTISRGMPGSSMPSWAHLSERTRWALVHYVKAFAEVPIAVVEGTSGEKAGIVLPPPEPRYTPEAHARAADVFQKACAPCHGATGRGDGVQKQFDDRNLPIRPRDLTLGIFKGSPKPEEVYRRIVAGSPGTPMPSSGYLAGEDAWHLVHYVLGLSSETQRGRVEMRKFEIRAPRVSAIPTHPDEGAWRDAPRVNLHLMPLWWRVERPEELTVQALHDGKELALRLSWQDETHDHTAMRPQDFRDGAAIEFAQSMDPPFFAMGGPGEPVNIWMWKSERQADLESTFQELDNVYPYMGIDSYPNMKRSPVEQPFRTAFTLDSDPTFVTGWGAGNIVSDPTRKSAVENLMAHGLGTLVALPRVDQTINAFGVFATSTYRVIFRRELAGSGDKPVKFQPGGSVAVAFAVWNGSAGDRDGKKSVTIWQDLRLDP